MKPRFKLQTVARSYIIVDTVSGKHIGYSISNWFDATSLCSSLNSLNTFQQEAEIEFFVKGK